MEMCCPEQLQYAFLFPAHRNPQLAEQSRFPVFIVNLVICSVYGLIAHLRYKFLIEFTPHFTDAAAVLTEALENHIGLRLLFPYLVPGCGQTAFLPGTGILVQSNADSVTEGCFIFLFGAAQAVKILFPSGRRLLRGSTSFFT